MIVPFQGMTVDAGVVIAVSGDELLQVGGGFGQVLDVESYVFDETGGSGLACAAYGGEDARTDSPVFGVLLRSVGEVHGDVSAERCQAGFDG